ncbi:myeloid zinc finger 1-like [Bacillus rossius redtenbacheri]|uniref:myeloid zinc finger 1-like n=1 Tax=Bacillus rossius redtenbacheri TaxID=93214 RepID=UPI002FDD957B
MPTRSEAGAQQGNRPKHSAGGSERLKRILLGDVRNTLGMGHKSVEGSSFQPWDVVTVELNENSEDAGGTDEEEEADVKEVEVLYPDFESEDGAGESAAAGPGPRTGACSSCGKMFRPGACLREHEASHVGEMKFFCKHCDKGFHTRARLGLHARAHLLRRCACRACGERFGKLRKHLLSHGCNQTFRSRDHLEGHSAAHLGERLHACPEARKTRPAVCPVCGKAFRRKEAMTKHMRVHTGERPYACPFCARRFSGKWNLTQHIRLHTGAKPYVCSHCGKAYRHNVTLRNHVRQIHENEVSIREIDL